MNKDGFIQAYSDIETPPCVDCTFYSTCIMERLACKQFKHYVGYEDRKDCYKKDLARHPVRKFYNDIFTDFGYTEMRHGP